MTAGQDVIDRPDVAELEELARRARVAIVKAIAHAQGGHLGGPLSATDMLTALYWRILNIRPDEPLWPERDRFILSKGHSSIALYAVMALRGYFPVEELDTFDAIGIYGQAIHIDPVGSLVIVTQSAWPQATGRAFSRHRRAFFDAVAASLH